MTFPDPRLERPGAPPELPDNTQDVIPRTERNEDPVRSDIEHGLTLEGARPLTDEERKAADRDAPVGERVYAPASERVPVEPVPGHRDVIEHTDTHTPEREAAAQTTPDASSPDAAPAPPGATSAAGGGSTEPTFTRVPRPITDAPTPGTYASALSHPGLEQSDDQDAIPEDSKRRTVFMGLGVSWFTVICVGVGVWWFMRWRRERNKPINRMRRQARQAAIQARQAASELRERVPSPEGAAKPAMGLTSALLSILVVLWRQSQARSDSADRQARRQASKAARRSETFTARATDVLSDVDWQNRLSKLKERWNPNRVEQEKVSISRH